MPVDANAFRTDPDLVRCQWQYSVGPAPRTGPLEVSFGDGHGEVAFDFVHVTAPGYDILDHYRLVRIELRVPPGLQQAIYRALVASLGKPGSAVASGPMQATPTGEFPIASWSNAVSSVKMGRPCARDGYGGCVMYKHTFLMSQRSAAPH